MSVEASGTPQPSTDYDPVPRDFVTRGYGMVSNASQLVAQVRTLADQVAGMQSALAAMPHIDPAVAENVGRIHSQLESGIETMQTVLRYATNVLDPPDEP